MGDVIGLNPLYNSYVAKAQSGSSNWMITSNKIYTYWTGNTNIVFNYPMYFTGYKYLCFDVEVTEGRTGNYNVSTVGLRKASNGWASDYLGCTNRAVNLTLYTNQTNYAGSSPWYTLTRQIVKVPVSDLTEAYNLALHCCDCAVNIYSIWLE